MAVVRNIQNNCYYRYIGDNIFENLNTGKQGKVDDEKAREIFRISLEMTLLVEENPLVCDLIKRCNLKADIQTIKI